MDTIDAGQLSSLFAQHDALIVGTPTWNTGADSQRSGTGWDDLYYGPLPGLKSVLQQTKVAVFGLGDQVSYAENYADAAGELYDVFESLGCDMVTYAFTSQQGYEHEDSKSIRGEQFCGLLLDQINQDDLTGERVIAWIAQLQAGGFTVGAETETAATPPTGTISTLSPVVSVVDVAHVEEDRLMLQHSSLEKDNGSNDGLFSPHYNPVTGKTMWTSTNGRSSYFT